MAWTPLWNAAKDLKLMNWTIRAAADADWTEIASLLTSVNLPLDGAREHLAGFLVAFSDDQLAGVAGMEHHGSIGLLRSVAVARRGTGLGKQLVQQLLDRATAEGLTSVVLLTQTAVDYFPRFGFRRIERQDAPLSVQKLIETQSACPTSAMMMELRLQDPAVTSRDEVALQKFADGYNCAQAVLFAWSDDINLDRDLALKLACGFGGGIARKGEVCGALTGGIIAISSKYGRGERDERTATEQTYAKIRTLMEKFESTFGATTCRQLLNGCDLATDEGKQCFRDNDLSNKVCKNCVRSVVQTLQGLL